MTSKGVLYIATGKKFVQAAVRSAFTVRKHCPDLPIHIFMDADNYAAFGFGKTLKPFTSVAIIEHPHRRSKVIYIRHTPFDWTLYMDTDTAWKANNSNLFQVLDRFDIGLAHAMHRNTPNSLLAWNLKLPDAFPQFNSGVIIYKKTPQVIALLEAWEEAFTESESWHDQPTLRELIWLSNLRIVTLPPEYNVRFIKYHFLWSKSEAVTKIFHLAQFHHGWFPWIYKGSGIKKIIRRFSAIKRKVHNPSEGKL